MKVFNVVTVFPEMIESIVNLGVIGQAQKSQKLSVKTYNPRDFTSDVHRTVDDRPFGGGDGMLMMAEPLALAIEAIANPGVVIYLSPQGELFDDEMAQEFAKHDSLTLVCGRYGGIDQRFLNEFVDREVSIGNYVLSGGELGAAAVIDATSRFVPGVLGHLDSAQQDSITSGYLEAPQFTRPRSWRSVDAPETLLSGDHAKIQSWRLFVGLILTLSKRPELLTLGPLEPQQFKKMQQFILELSAQEREVLGLSGVDLETLLRGLKL